MVVILGEYVKKVVLAKVIPGYRVAIQLSLHLKLLARHPFHMI